MQARVHLAPRRSKNPKRERDRQRILKRTTFASTIINHQYWHQAKSVGYARCLHCLVPWNSLHLQDNFDRLAQALEAMLKGERVRSDKKKKSARDAGPVGPVGPGDP